MGGRDVVQIECGSEGCNALTWSADVGAAVCQGSDGAVVAVLHCDEGGRETVVVGSVDVGAEVGQGPDGAVVAVLGCDEHGRSPVFSHTRRA